MAKLAWNPVGPVRSSGTACSLWFMATNMMSVIDDFTRLLVDQLAAAGVTINDVECGLEALRIGAMQLALEGLEAENAGLPLDEAVRCDRFPRLVAAHNTIEDVLRMDTPHELRPFVRRMFDMPEPPQVDRLHQAVAQYAARERGPHGALARFVFFELTRIGLYVATWRERPRLTRFGVDDPFLDRLAAANAETELALAAQSDQHGEGRPDPLALAVSTTVIEASALHDLAATAMTRIHDDLRRVYARRAKIEDLLLDAPSAETVLVRNAFATSCQQPYVETARLEQLHPIALAGLSVDAIDKRASRSREALRNNAPLPARKHALIDLLVCRWDRSTERHA